VASGEDGIRNSVDEKQVPARNVFLSKSDLTYMSFFLISVTRRCKGHADDATKISTSPILTKRSSQFFIDTSYI
jgi:hypothetical protein